MGPVYDNEKESCRILTNKEFYKMLKKPAIGERIRINRLRWFGHVQRMEENRISKNVLNINLETRVRGRPRNRWQDEVRKDGRPAGGMGVEGKSSQQRGVEEAAENCKESSHSALVNVWMKE